MNEKQSIVNGQSSLVNANEENNMVSACRRLLDILALEQVDIAECNLDAIQHCILIKENIMKEMQDPANAASWNSEAHIHEFRDLMNLITEHTALNEKALLRMREQLSAKIGPL